MILFDFSSSFTRNREKHSVRNTKLILLIKVHNISIDLPDWVKTRRTANQTQTAVLRVQKQIQGKDILLLSCIGNQLNQARSLVNHWIIMNKEHSTVHWCNDLLCHIAQVWVGDIAHDLPFAHAITGFDKL